MMAPASISQVLDADVSAAAAGDRDAFARLVAATSGVVCAIGLAILRDVAESQDVAQDVFVSAWRDMRTLRNPSSFLPWIRQLARNRAHHVLRTTRRRERRITLAESSSGAATDHIERRTDEVLSAATDPVPSALERIVAEEESAALRTVLSELPHAAREVVILYYREGGSVQQVAALLGLSDAAVKQRLARARTRVRDALLAKGGDELRASTPGAAVVSAIIAAVGLTVAPAPAAAAGIGTAASLLPRAVMHKARGAGAAVFGAAGTAALAGMFGGLTGVFAGRRRMLALARDEEERRGIRRHSTVMMIAVTQFAVAILFWPRNDIVVTASFVLLATAIIFGQLVWLPRITASRHAAEAREGGISAFDQARWRHRTMARLAFALAIAGAPIVAAWFLRW